jgi:hypothetical protein
VWIDPFGVILHIAVGEFLFTITGHQEKKLHWLCPYVVSRSLAIGKSYAAGRGIRVKEAEYELDRRTR